MPLQKNLETYWRHLISLAGIPTSGHVQTMTHVHWRVTFFYFLFPWLVCSQQVPVWNLMSLSGKNNYDYHKRILDTCQPFDFKFAYGKDLSHDSINSRKLDLNNLYWLVTIYQSFVSLQVLFSVSMFNMSNLLTPRRKLHQTEDPNIEKNN